MPYYRKRNAGNAVIRDAVPMPKALLRVKPLTSVLRAVRVRLTPSPHCWMSKRRHWDEEHGEVSDIKKVAYIREDECIGCTKCIQACPVDAILGAAKHMHTVIAAECTGCDLCVEPCPVDCIDMLPVTQTLQQWQWERPTAAAIIATDRIATDRVEAA